MMGITDIREGEPITFNTDGTLLARKYAAAGVIGKVLTIHTNIGLIDIALSDPIAPGYVCRVPFSPTDLRLLTADERAKWDEQQKQAAKKKRRRKASPERARQFA